MKIYVLEKGNHDEKKQEPCKKSLKSKSTFEDLEGKNIISLLGSLKLDAMTSGVDFETPPMLSNPMEARIVTRTNKKKTKTVLIDPIFYDNNYPVKGYFNLEKSITVLAFADGTKVKTVADNTSRSKAHTGVIISLAKRILGPQSETDRNSIGAIYNKFGSDAQAEAALYGVVMSYFVSNGLVKDPATFDLWMVEFLTSRLVQITEKKS